MVYVRHIKGGSVTFVRDGQMVTMTVGTEGEIPDHVYGRYATRFEKIERPPAASVRPTPSSGQGIPHQTTQMQRDEAFARFVARHRGAGKWAVWDTIANTAMGDPTDREEAERMAAAYNAANVESGP